MEESAPTNEPSVEAETYFRIWGEFPSSDPHDIERIRAKAAPPTSVAQSGGLKGEDGVSGVLTAIESLLMATTEKLASIDSRLSALETEMKELNNRTDSDGS